MTQKNASQLTDEEIEGCRDAGNRAYMRHRWSTRGQQITPRDSPDWHFARAVESAVLARAAVPAQPTGDAATARDAGAMWDRFIAHLNECDSIEHVNLLGGVAKYRQAFIDAALSSTPAQGDASGVPACGIDRATVLRLAREASSGDGGELSGDAIERFAQLVFLEAAAGVPASEWTGTTEPKLLWCRQCGEGVQPGLCRRPKGTEQPAECAADGVKGLGDA